MNAGIRAVKCNVSAVAQKALEKALANDLAVVEARLGKNEWPVRYGHYPLFLKMKHLLPMIDCGTEPNLPKERERAVEEAGKSLPGMRQDELRRRRAEVDRELEDGRKMAPALLKEYAASFAGGIESVLAAIDRGVREKLEKLIERRDELSVLRDAIDRFIRWPTGPC